MIAPNIRSPLRGIAVLLIAALGSACGGQNSSTPPSNNPGPIQGDQILAAQITATQNTKCLQIVPFYFEIGDENGVITSASVGGNTYTATTQMNIASAPSGCSGPTLLKCAPEHCRPPTSKRHTCGAVT